MGRGESSTQPGRAETGREVLSRPIGFFFSEVERRGHSPELLVEGIDLSREQLCARHGRIDWASFRTLMRNLGRILSDEELVDAGARMARSPWVQPFTAVTRLVFSCEGAYRWMAHPRFGPVHQNFTCLRPAVEDLGPGRIAIRVRMAPGYEPSRELFLIARGTFQTVPRQMGLPKATVELIWKDDGAEYRIAYPVRRTLIGWLEHVVAWPRALRTAGVELREATERLFQSNHQLASEISSRASAEAALREQESSFYKAFHAAPTLMAITSLEGDFIDVNEAFARANGLARYDLIGHNTSEFGFWSGSKARDAILERLLRGEPVQGVEQEFIAPSGERRFGLVSAETIQVSGQRRIIWQAADITDRKRAEEENRRLQEKILHARKLESLGVMAGGIAHDFNNLLVGIQGNAELALAGSESEGQRTLLSSIITSCSRAAELTGEMLDYAGKGTRVIAPVDLAELVEQTVDLVRDGLRPEISMRFARDTDDSIWIMGDQTQIRQVVMNLASNAGESYAGSDGTVDVRVGVMAVSGGSHPASEIEADECVYVEVRDRGCGMDRATLSRIFDPFFTTKFTGRGLGLATSLGIVKGHRGVVDVDSEPGSGTMFRVMFPRTQPKPLVVAAPERVPDAEGGLVLIVDDEEQVRGVVEQMLIRAGYSTLSAENGDEGVELLEQNRDEIAAVLLDLTMPGMSGRETFEAMRRIRPTVPVICCSGYGDEVGSRFIEGRPGVSFLGKPFRFDDLRRAVFEAVLTSPNREDDPGSDSLQTSGSA